MRWLYMILTVKKNSGITILENEKNTEVIYLLLHCDWKTRGSSSVPAGRPAIITVNHPSALDRPTLLRAGANSKNRNDPTETTLLSGQLEQTEPILSVEKTPTKSEFLSPLSLSLRLLPGSSSPFSILILFIPNYCYNDYVIIVNYVEKFIIIIDIFKLLCNL